MKIGVPVAALGAGVLVEVVVVCAAGTLNEEVTRGAAAGVFEEADMD